MYGVIPSTKQFYSSTSNGRQGLIPESFALVLPKEKRRIEKSTNCEHKKDEKGGRGEGTHSQTEHVPKEAR